MRKSPSARAACAGTRRAVDVDDARARSRTPRFAAASGCSCRAARPGRQSRDVEPRREPGRAEPQHPRGQVRRRDSGRARDRREPAGRFDRRVAVLAVTLASSPCVHTSHLYRSSQESSVRNGEPGHNAVTHRHALMSSARSASVRTGRPCDARSPHRCVCLRRARVPVTPPGAGSCSGRSGRGRSIRRRKRGRTWPSGERGRARGDALKTWSRELRSVGWKGTTVPRHARERPAARLHEAARHRLESVTNGSREHGRGLTARRGALGPWRDACPRLNRQSESDGCGESACTFALQASGSAPPRQGAKRKAAAARSRGPAERRPHRLVPVHGNWSTTRSFAY